jgi:phytoene synthase
MTDISSASDMASCRELLRDGSRTFFAASLVLPRRVADPAIALYAFCRLADDAVDLGNDRIAAVARLQERLDRGYRRQPMPHAADRAFAAVVEKFAIPYAVPQALLEGLAWDAASRRYETIEQLYDYAARVAGTVGVMMTLVMGQRRPEIVARACDLGVAMQLTNIARDVGEDARAGRLYLPLKWLREMNIDPDVWMANPVFNREIAMIVQRLLDVADAFYDRATMGIQNLPASCRPGIYAARALYAEIGREVERAGFDSVSQRAVVSTGRKLATLAATVAWRESEWASDRPFQRLAAPITATQFLIEAVVATPLHEPAQPAKLKPWPIKLWRIEQRLIWVLELFERLERRDQLQRGRS